MPQISVRVDGNVKVGKGMAALGAAIEDITNEELEAGLEATAKEAGGGWQGGASYQVPIPQGSSYQRTGTLGAMTTWEIVGRTYRITSNAISPRGVAYGKYVIGDGSGAGQTRKHKETGWPLMFEVAQKWAKTLIDKIDNRIRRKASEEGLGL